MLGERCSSRSSRSIASIAQIGRCSGGHKHLRLWQHLLERGEITRIVIRDRGLDLIGKRLRIGQGSLDTDEGPVQMAGGLYRITAVVARDKDDLPYGKAASHHICLPPSARQRASWASAALAVE